MGFQHGVELWNLRAWHSITLVKTSADVRSNLLGSVILGIKPGDESDLLDIPFLCIPHVLAVKAIAVFQELECLGMALELTKRDTDKNAIDISFAVVVWLLILLTGLL